MQHLQKFYSVIFFISLSLWNVFTFFSVFQTSESKDIAHLMLTSTNQTVKNAEWRTQVVMAMAESGIPLHKLEIEGVPSRLHRILSHGGSLGNRGNLADIYPVLLRRELELIHQEVQEGAAEFNSGAVLLGYNHDSYKYFSIQDLNIFFSVSTRLHCTARLLMVLLKCANATRSCCDLSAKTAKFVIG